MELTRFDVRFHTNSKNELTPLSLKVIISILKDRRYYKTPHRSSGKSRKRSESTMNSPHPNRTLRISQASALALGLTTGRFFRDAAPACINLLQNFDGGCRASCAYCGLSRTRRSAETKTFIRVRWPEVNEVHLYRLLEENHGRIERICLATVIHPHALEELLRQIDWLAKLNLPISALVSSLQLNRSAARSIYERGARILGIGMDAASPTVMAKARGGKLGKWEVHWRAVEEALNVFGSGCVNVHLVVGLGETDAQLLDTATKLFDLGAGCFLFSFFPEPGTLMANSPRPSLRRWRRLQLTTYLLRQRLIESFGISFDEEGMLLGLNIDEETLLKTVSSGRPFETHGCPGKNVALACTRPFGSYRPGEPFRDYPFPPTNEDIAAITAQLDLPSMKRQ